MASIYVERLVSLILFCQNNFIVQLQMYGNLPDDVEFLFLPPTAVDLPILPLTTLDTPRLGRGPEPAPTMALDAKTRLGLTTVASWTTGLNGTIAGGGDDGMAGGMMDAAATGA